MDKKEQVEILCPECADVRYFNHAIDKQRIREAITCIPEIFFDPTQETETHIKSIQDYLKRDLGL